MNAFRVDFTSSAQRDIAGLSPATRSRILARIRWMGDNAAVIPHQALHGEDWHGAFRFRVGDYRVVYRLDRTTRVLTILNVGHRRDVYR
ncbi:MAG: type II toxin-antitoxin system RelE/ParE family toxin [Dehalococcoidia bacterium]